MDELLRVVTFHLPRFENTVKTCKNCPNQVNLSDLTFATRFVSMYLFIKVKGSRPMTYQYLTVDMVDAAKANGEFIDQKIFKTAGKYGFDSLILTDVCMQVLDNYISIVRPLLNPRCDYVLVTTNGSQHSKLGDVMSKLVFDAIGKYIHRTRYRKIVETQSLNQLTSSEQKILSEDQKHSSALAKIHDQKQRSREVAVKGHECPQKLQGSKGSEVDEDVHARFGVSNSASATSVENAEIEVPPRATTDDPPIEHLHLHSLGRHRRVLKFTSKEDDFLKKGMDRHGFGQWTAILRDPEFKFQEGRTTDSLKTVFQIAFACRPSGWRGQKGRRLFGIVTVLLELSFCRQEPSALECFPSSFAT